VAAIQELKQRRVKRPSWCGPLAAAGALWLAGCVVSAPAQEAVRMSMASAQAAEGRHRAATSEGYYNVKLGPMAWNFGAGLGLEYSDNVGYTQYRGEADFSLRPQINARMRWPVSEWNSINLSLGAGYVAYLEQTQLNRFFISADSDSGLSLDIYAGDFYLELHDRISITEDPYRDPTVAGDGRYSRLQNAAGITTIWDLNKVILQLNYDHVNSVTLSGRQGYGDLQSEVVSFSAGYAPKAGIRYGVEVGGSWQQYEGGNTYADNAWQWNVGGFGEAQISEYISFAGHAGYTVYTPQTHGALTREREYSTPYVALSFRHRVNAYVDYSLSGGRTLPTSLTGGAVDMYTANWSANWRVIRKTSLSTGFSYYHGSSVSSGGETFDQYGPQITLGWRLARKLSSNLSYRLYWRTSDQAGRDYSVNVVSLNFNYAF
jgi:hypothetical protein